MLKDDAGCPVVLGRDVGRINPRLDTVELIFRRVPQGFRRQIESALDRRILIKPCRDSTGVIQGWRAIINRPNLPVMPLMDWYLRDCDGCCIHRVDVAIDFEMDNEKQADALIDVLRKSVILKWRRARRRRHIRSTTYWVEGRSGRNLCLYSRRQTRGRVARLELRFRNAAVVRRAGLSDIPALMEINPSRLFAHNMKIAQFKERYRIAAVRRAVKEDRLRHLNKQRTKPRSQRTEAFLDCYRSMIPDRVRSILEGLEMQDFVSGNRDGHRSIQKLDLAVLGIPKTLEWPSQWR